MSAEIVNNDPWKHRSKGLCCATCMWFVKKVKDTGPQPPQTGAMQTIANNTPDKELGRCRRHAPTMNGYPVVFTSDWCGDHKLDENKI